MLLSPFGNLSHTSILYYYYVNWTQVVNKNQSTRSSKQIKTAGDSTEYDKDKA